MGMNDFTEHPLKLVGLAERNGDLFLLFDGEPGQHVFHQRTDDAEEWAAFTECSVGSITAREVYEAARPHLDRAANSLTTTDFRKQARQLLEKFWAAKKFHVKPEFYEPLVSDIVSLASGAATQGQQVGIERAAKVECNFCKQGNVPTFIEFEFRHKLEGETPWTVCRAGRIRALSPDPSYLDRVRHETATAERERILKLIPCTCPGGVRPTVTVHHKDCTLAAIGNNNAN